MIQGLRIFEFVMIHNKLFLDVARICDTKKVCSSAKERVPIFREEDLLVNKYSSQFINEPHFMLQGADSLL